MIEMQHMHTQHERFVLIFSSDITLDKEAKHNIHNGGLKMFVKLQNSQSFW